MKIFKIIGVLMIILGVLSCIYLLLQPFGVPLNTETSVLWALFAFTFIGGSVFYCIGDSDSISTVLKTSGSILLIICLFAAAMILASAIGILKTDESGELWALFIVCGIGGTVAIIYSKDVNLSNPKK